MAKRRDQTHELELLEQQIGLLLERAFDLAVTRPPAIRKARLRHLAHIRRAAMQVVIVTDKAIEFLKTRA